MQESVLSVVAIAINANFKVIVVKRAACTSHVYKHE